MDVKKAAEVAVSFIGKATKFIWSAWWRVFPLCWALYIVPDWTMFLKELGRELPPLTLALFDYSLVCGVICAIINMVYTAWRFFIKRYPDNLFLQNNVFKYDKFFSIWIFTTNSMLTIWLVLVILTPVYAS